MCHAETERAEAKYEALRERLEREQRRVGRLEAELRAGLGSPRHKELPGPAIKGSN